MNKKIVLLYVTVVLAVSKIELYPTESYAYKDNFDNNQAPAAQPPGYDPYQSEDPYGAPEISLSQHSDSAHPVQGPYADGTPYAKTQHSYPSNAHQDHGKPYKPQSGHPAPNPEPQYGDSVSYHPASHEHSHGLVAASFSKDGKYRIQESGYNSNPYNSNSGFGGKNSGGSIHGASSSSHSHGPGDYRSSSPSKNGFSGSLQSYAPSYSFGNPYQKEEKDCFRMYRNCMISHAQPYERRSGVTLDECKHLCLDDSGDDHFICQSFVYDYKHFICDLFAHTGNQYPAKLVSFYGKDYFEKKHYKCEKEKTTTAESTETTTVAEETTTATTSSMDTTTGPLRDACPTGMVSRYSSIDNMILEGNDDINLGSSTIEQCLSQCTNRADCLSLDVQGGQCMLARNAALPTGTGQLRTGVLDGTYFEKVCVSANSAANCAMTFRRFPQMILLGFADSVLDANSFEECYQLCIDSQINLGFRCLSASYYYTELQQNCILIGEDRSTQPTLFIPENTEMVDYFETNCINGFFGNQQRGRFGLRLSGGRKRVRDRFLTTLGAFAPVISESQDVQIASPTQELNYAFNPISDGWMEWSPCDKLSQGRRFRFQICSATFLTDCPMETQWCNAGGTNLSVLKEEASQNSNDTKFANLEQRGLSCPNDECCPVFGGCRIGVKMSSIDKNIMWCTNPCNN